LTVWQWEISQSSCVIVTSKTDWSAHSRPDHTWRKCYSCPTFTSRSSFRKLRNIPAVSWHSFSVCTMLMTLSQLTLIIVHVPTAPSHAQHHNSHLLASPITLIYIKSQSLWCSLLLLDYFLPEDGGRNSLQNNSNSLPLNMGWYSRRLESSSAPLWDLKISHKTVMCFWIRLVL
jgi:hypothetical protein